MQHLLGAFPRIRAGIDVGVCRPVHEIESTDSAESRWGSLRRGRVGLPAFGAVPPQRDCHLPVGCT